MSTKPVATRWNIMAATIYLTGDVSCRVVSLGSSFTAAWSTAAQTWQSTLRRKTYRPSFASVEVNSATRFTSGAGCPAGIAAEPAHHTILNRRIVRHRHLEAEGLVGPAELGSQHLPRPC